MKVLLVSDVPPSTNYTGGLMLDQLVRFLPQGSVACFSVLDRRVVHPQVAADLAWLRIARADKPRERWNVFPGWRGEALSVVMESLSAALAAPALVRRAVRFGREFGAEAVWCMLQGQTLIRLARPVAEGLGVPLLAQVWDPPGWWLRENRVDRRSAQSVLGAFDEALRASRACAAASGPMAEAYRQRYGVKTVPVMPSLDPALAQAPATAPRPGPDLVIGMAGQIYARREWDALIAALDSADWRLGGRQVKIRLLGTHTEIRASGKSFIEYLGWRPQAEAIRLLADADLLYCPYWFDREFEEEARLSFPGKLATYFAAGRPVLVHAPDYASPARYVSQHRAGRCCDTLEPKGILDALRGLLDDTSAYAEAARNGRAAFERDFTLATMSARFQEFVGAAAPRS